jgi:hypothetical protein
MSSLLMPEPTNINSPVIRIAHSELERWDEDSAYKSKCPTCKDGVLLIHRDMSTLKLKRHDMCVSCGQQFYYTDERIRWETFDSSSTTF